MSRALSNWEQDHSPEALDALLSSTLPFHDKAFHFLMFGSSGCAEVEYMSNLITPRENPKMPMTAQAIYKHLRKKMPATQERNRFLLEAGKSHLSLAHLDFTQALANVLEQDDKSALLALIEQGHVAKPARFGVLLLDERFGEYQFTPGEEARLRKSVGRWYNHELCTHPHHYQNDVSFIMRAVNVSHDDAPLQKFLYERMKQNELYQLPVFLEHKCCPRLDIEHMRRIMAKHSSNFRNDLIVTKYVAEWGGGFLLLEEAKKRLDEQVALHPQDDNYLAKQNRMAQIDTGTRYLKKYGVRRRVYELAIASFCGSVSYERDHVRPVSAQSLLT